MATVIAGIGGAAVYAMLCWFLGFILYKVMGPFPLWMRRMFHWRWEGTLKGFYTVRYEIDDDGLWQIVEEVSTRNRYRIHIRNADGAYRW